MPGATLRRQLDAGLTTTLMLAGMAVALWFAWQDGRAWTTVATACLLLLSFEDLRRRRRHAANERLQQDIVDAVPDILFFKDASLRYRRINRAFAGTFGTTAGGAIGLGDVDLFGPRLGARFAAQDRALLASREARTFDEQMTIEGELRALRMRKQPVFDARGRPVGVVGIAIDVTGERRLQQELADANARLGVALHAARMGVWEWDLATGALRLDEATRHILRLPPDVLTADAVFDRMPPEDAASVRGLLEAVAVHRQEVDYEFRVVDADGGVRWIEGAATARSPEAGRVRLIGINRDITERQREKEALAQALDAKGQFLAMMSHEIRTPMNGVLGMIDLLADTVLDPVQRRLLARSRESSIALLTIINDILDFSKIEAGKLELERRAVSLHRLAEAVCAALAPDAAARRVALRTRVDDALPPYVVADPVRLRQILTNLAGNAVKFTQDGVVDVELTRIDDRHLRLRVRDTGVGIAPETLRTLFRPFEQADAATTRRFGGTGLGLSIVKRLANLMGGDVHCESAPGVGSTFDVLLPLEEWHPTLHDAAPPTTRTPDLRAPRGLHALLAEDHPINRELIEAQLAKLGWTCDCAEDGEQAWDILRDAGRAARYALLITDCHMPRLDGYGLVQRLRAHEAATSRTRLPVVALTANALQGERERCLALGMDAYLAKPLQLHELDAALVAVLVPGDAPPYPFLHQACGGDGARVAALLRLCGEQAALDARGLRSALDAGDARALQLHAHRLLSVARHLGDEALTTTLVALEAAADDAAIDTWGALHATTQAALEVAIARAQAYADTLPTG
jgi:PAS domain S-box-containing protein